MRKRVNLKLEELFSKEGARLQGLLEEVRRKMGSLNLYEAREAIVRAMTALVRSPKYSVRNSGIQPRCHRGDFSGMFLL